MYYVILFIYSFFLGGGGSEDVGGCFGFLVIVGFVWFRFFFFLSFSLLHEECDK